MDRYLQAAIAADLGSKILLISGPRQCGKTTLSRMIHPDHQYINHDLAEHRLLLREKSWDRRKAPKYYFYDNSMVQSGDGVRLENLVACSLLKEVHRAQDVEGEELGLHYIRDRDGREVDFLITRNGLPWRMVEVKWRDAAPSAHLRRFLADESVARVQVVGELAQSKSFPDGLRVEPAMDFLLKLDFGPAGA